MPNINVNFHHPPDGRTVSVNLDNTITAQEAIQELINAEFIPRNPYGYNLAVKGGPQFRKNQSFAAVGIKENDTISVLPDMHDDSVSNHLTVETLVDYFDKAMAEEEIEAVELHFAECDACARRSRQAFTLCNEWEQWTGMTDRESFQRTLIYKSLQEAIAEEQTGIPRCKERLERWLERWRTASASLARDIGRAVTDVAQNTARSITEEAEHLLHSGTTAPFDLQWGAVRVRGTRDRGLSPKIKVTLASGPWAQLASVAADASTGTVFVLVESWPQEQIEPLVLLAGEGRKTRVNSLERLPHGEGLMAQFEKVEPGNYIVDLEPQ